MRDIVVHNYETIDKLILWNVADIEINKLKEFCQDILKWGDRMSELEKISQKIGQVARKYNLMYVWVFGSYAKKKQKEDSDIDILVRTEDVADGFKIVDVKFALEEALEKEVDIVTTGSIKGSLLEDEDLEEVLVYSYEKE